MTHCRFFGIAAAFCIGLLFIHLPFSIAQDVAVSQTAESDDEPEPMDPLMIKVSANEIRLDVVVVDGRGRPITDLTADDFEIYQDKLPQNVTSSVYVGNQSEAAAAQPAFSRKDAPNLPRPPSTILKEEEVNRTILFVVDTLSMQFAHLHSARMSIKGFLENQMQPGDLVAILRTGSGNSALNMFSSDKRYISMRTDAIPNQGLPDGCYGDFAPMIYDNQLSTLYYSIRALKDMPGRKILFFKTACPYIQKPFDNFTTPVAGGGSVITRESERAKNPSEMYAGPFDRLADEALRAGVVIHSLDVRGLTIDANVSDFSAVINPLPTKTGGIFLTNANYFLNGIGNDANNMIAGYYLLSYVPPPATFDSGRENVFNRVEVRVRRRGAVVYTRDGFYGRAENETDTAETPAHPLVKAILSPFQFADLNVNMAAGYVKGPGFGVIQYRTVAKASGFAKVPVDPQGVLPDYLVRAWIHLDPEDVKIVEREDGGARIILETVCLTSDIDGKIHDLREIKYTFNLEPEKKSENIAWIQKHGIRFTLLLPVDKPGAYTVHVAIRDTESGKTGSAYQFVEIPDLKKKGLEMSSVFMIAGADDLVWMGSDAAKELAQGVFYPIFQEDDVRTPALRSYGFGDRLHMLAMLYNADAKAISRSEIEIQSLLYKDGKEFLRGESRPIDRNEAPAPEGISIFQRLTVGPEMPPGDYLLQLLATDKKNSEKRDEEGVANQKKPGFFTRIWRAYINEPHDPNKNDKGVATQILSFTVTEE